MAALLVLLYHCDTILASPRYFGVGVPAFRAGNSGVQLFFVLSGFVIYYAHFRDAEHSAAAIRTFIRKRVRRLYPPLWAVLVVVVPIVVMSGQSGSADLIGAFAITPVAVERVLAVEWTLRHEVLFYAVFTCFLWSRRYGWVMMAGWAAASCVALFAADIIANWHWLALFVFSVNHALFVMGMLTARLFLSGWNRITRTVLLAGSVLFLATYIAAATGRISHDVAILPWGLGASAIIFGLVADPRWRISRPLLEGAGKASYSLYLIHYPLLSVLVKIAMRFHLNHLPSWLIALTFAAICQMAALIFHRWVERFAISLFDTVMLASRRRANGKTP